MKLFKLLSLFIFVSSLTFAQDLKLDWTEKMTFTKKGDGYFKGFIGSNSKYIYAKYGNYTGFGSKKKRMFKLVALDKETLKKKFEVAILGYDSGINDKYADLDYEKIEIYEDKILLFWSKEDKKKQEIYAESYTSELKKDQKLKKIYQYTVKEDLKRTKLVNRTYVRVLTNEHADNRFIIGAEVQDNDDLNFFKYTQFDLNFEQINEGEIRLPGSLNGKKSTGAYSTYRLEKDGNLYIKTRISVDKDELKAAKQEKKIIDRSYMVFTIWNFDLDNSLTFELKDKDKAIEDFSYVVTEKGISLYGFFGDLEKDQKSASIYGVFFTNISNENFEFNGLNYSYFTKKQLEELFKSDEGAKKSGKTKVLATKETKKKAKENAEESISVYNTIEWIYINDAGEIVLFFSNMYNYTVRVCTTTSNGAGGTTKTCYDEYYCRKSDVTALKINAEGEFIWGSHVDRSITYSGWDIYDLSIIQTKDDYYVIDGSAMNSVPGKSKKKRKKASEFRDTFEYATFNKETGKNSVNVFQVNTPDEEDKKQVNPLSLVVVDDKFYMTNIKSKMNVGKSLPLLILGVGCPYLYMIPMVNPNFRKISGNFGVIYPIEGSSKRSKSKK